MIEDLAAMLREIDKSRQTVVCHPATIEVLQALLDEKAAGALVTLVPSDLVPIDKLYVLQDSIFQLNRPG